MTTSPPDEKAIFNAARQLSSQDARRDFIEHACGDDANLRGRVEALLRILDKNTSFLQSAAEEVQSLADDRVCEGPGTMIGPYKLLEQIGEGGFGVVFLAEQTEPVRRKVALKVIKPGMDSRQIIARFEAERQALAMMDHPNIAKVHDGGIIPFSIGDLGFLIDEKDNQDRQSKIENQKSKIGRPYFVMELVQGIPITKYCDDNHLTPRERLELFVPVCNAIQHAHQKGIIHRDIKPSNVMITLYDGKPTPKVIDFGVAKATGTTLTEETLHTGFGAVVGTVEYMSPEQASLNRLDIDTRSDIYSLGVLLYELLTGSPPFCRKELEQDGVLELLRVIREQEPSKPSTKLSTAEGLPTLAANRGTEPAKLTKLVRGELDWIVMRALEKDRSRRYETANGLAMDVQRYLADEPVRACPPSAGYRLRKFVRRNKAPVLAASLVFVALAAGMAGTTWGMFHAQQARRDAQSAQLAEAERAEGESRAKEEAQKRLAQIETGTETLASMIRDLDPIVAEKEGLALPDLVGRRLGEAARQFDGESVGDPLVVARLQHVLGISLRELGHLQQAEVVLVKASQTRERLLGAGHLDTIATQHDLAMLYRAQVKYAPAEALYKEVVAVRTAKLGADHRDTLSSRHEQSLLYHSQNRLALAETSLTEVLAIRTATLGADHPDTLTSQHRLAMLYYSLGKSALAETVYQDVLAIRSATLGADHLDTIATKANLARLYLTQGKFAQAEPLFLEVLAVRTAKLGADHPDTLGSQANLAQLHHYQGDYAAAEALFKKVIALRTRRLGAEHRATLGTKNSLAALYRNQGEFAKAEALYQDVLAVHTAARGADHPATLSTKYDLAVLYGSMYKLDRSIPLFEETLQLMKAKLGPDHPDTLVTQTDLGSHYCAAGRFAEAIPLLEEVRAKAREHRELWLQVGNELLTAYLGAGKTTPASALVTEHVQATRKHHAADRPRLAIALAETGNVLLGTKKYAKAEPLLRESLALGQEHAPDAWDTHRTMSLLGGALLGQKKYADAEPLLVHGFEGLEKRQAQEPYADDIWRTWTLDRVVELYVAWDKPERTAQWRQKREAASRRMK